MDIPSTDSVSSAHEQELTPAGHVRGNGVTHVSPEEHAGMDAWSKRYLKLQKDGSYEYSALWGEDPSETVISLRDDLRALKRQLREGGHPSSRKPFEVFEFGFGYARDAKALLKAGCKVTGIENSTIGLQMATIRVNDYFKKGRASLLVADFRKAAIPVPEGKYDAAYSHRVLHLLMNGEVKAFADLMARIVKPEGLLYLGARDPRDFNPKRMSWVSDGVASVKGRDNHLISFWDAARYQKVFGSNFDIVGMRQTREIESMDMEDVQSAITIVKAVRKKDGLGAEGPK